MTEKSPQSVGQDVRIIDIGLGKVVSNWGSYLGRPAIFIEPVLGDAGQVGADVKGEVEPQIRKDSVSDGGTVLVFHTRDGARVIKEDIESALVAVLTT